MLPVVLEPQNLCVGVAGSGEGMRRRLNLLNEAGVNPSAVASAETAPDMDLRGLNLLFVAGLGEADSSSLAARARESGVLVNVEDRPSLCDFHMPAQVRRGNLLLTVSTGGRAPGLSRALREELELLFGPEWDARLEEIAQLRDRWRNEGAAPAEVSERMRAHLEGRGLARVSVVAFQQSGSVVDAPLKERLAELRVRAERLDASGLIELALKDAFSGRTAVISSFAAESVVLLHLVAAVDPETPILFLNTGKLFGETLRYRDRLQEVLGLTDIRAIGPHPIERGERDPEGTLWSRDPDACCHFRKVVPLGRAIKGFDALVTGRKRFQTQTRVSMEKLELANGRFRFNPLVDWTLDDLTRYVEDHGLPKHPLVHDGYPSIGCMPCTRRVAAGEGYRAGRWSGLGKEECGIHAGVDGDGI